MAVEIKLVSPADANDVTSVAQFSALDLATGETLPIKNWYEKSKNKWHIVLGQNSANRKYIAHNEFFAKMNNDVYIVEDKTTGPRTLGTSQPDKKLVPYMTSEDKEMYEAIISRAAANRESQKKTKPVTEEERYLAQIAKLEKKLAKIKG